MEQYPRCAEKTTKYRQEPIALAVRFGGDALGHFPLHHKSATGDRWAVEQGFFDEQGGNRIR
jgi:hypothetical protein